MKLKKPKFWDYKRANYLSYLLLPLTLPIIINNYFLKLNKNKNLDARIKKICVGNIYVGGTAKTPLTIKIFNILKNFNLKSATIKKFYPDQIDEQRLLTANTKLYCFKKRQKALNEAIKDGIDVAVFDDGLQDRSINYDLKFVCFNNINFVGNGFLMPAGPLREKIESISKYDAVFINGNEKDNTNLKIEILKHNKEIKIFESCYRVTNLSQFNLNEKYIIFSGIGNPESFKEILLLNKFNIIKEITFPDHYKYTQNDIEKIKSDAINLNAKILTTEKDFIKINLNKNKDIEFLKIDLDIKDEKRLFNYLKKYI